MILYILIALCVFILIAMIYRYDMHHKEPWYMALLAILLGAAAYWAIGPVSDWVLFKLNRYDELTMALVAGIGEELAKFALVLMIAAVFRKHFDDPMDGIVYGALIGIGFALAESTFYIGFTQERMPNVSRQDLFGQEAVRSILHCLTGGLGGFGVGLARCQVPKWRQILPAWLGATILIHFAWDFACGLNQANDFQQIVMQRGAAIGLMLTALVLFRIAVWVADNWCKAHCQHH